MVRRGRPVQEMLWMAEPLSVLTRIVNTQVDKSDRTVYDDNTRSTVEEKLDKSTTDDPGQPGQPHTLETCVFTKGAWGVLFCFSITSCNCVLVCNYLCWRSNW